MAEVSGTPYEYQPFPRRLYHESYHSTGRSILVENQAQRDALHELDEGEWHETPATCMTGFAPDAATITINPPILRPRQSSQEADEPEMVDTDLDSVSTWKKPAKRK